MGRANLLLIGLAVSLVQGQIHNEDCSYGQGQPGPNLCIPRFCEAPKLYDQRLSRGPYVFEGATASGKVANHTFTATFGGYDLNVICPNSVRLLTSAEHRHWNPGDRAPPAMPPIPNFPRGCQAISPLPTLTQEFDRDFIPVWIVVVVYLFYALAMVCEEFLVPAINMVVEKTGMPEDVAGATLLAAGCNSPEFFSSIIGIFVADSTVGVGTVIGSAPFNVCCITAGASLAVGGALVLDPWLMARELTSLMMVLVMFMIFLDDYLVDWWEALILVVWYGCYYVPLLANFDKVKRSLLRCFAGQQALQAAGDVELEDQSAALAPGSASGGGGSVRAINETTGGLQDVRASLSQLASAKDASGSTKLAPRSGRAQTAPNTGLSTASERTSEPPLSNASAPPMPAAAPLGNGGLFDTLATSLLESLATKQTVTFVVPKHEIHPEAAAALSADAVDLRMQTDGIKPKLLNDHRDEADDRNAHSTDYDRWKVLAEMCKRRLDAYPDSENGFSGVLLKKPRGFTKVSLRRVPYQARYFKIDGHQTHPLRYCHVEGNLAVKFASIPVQSVLSITRCSEVEIQLKTSKQTYKLRTLYNDDRAGDTMQRWFDHLVVTIDSQRNYAPPPKLPNEEHEEAHEHPPWYQWPETASEQVAYVLTIPIKAPVFLTTPNVLVKGNEKFYPITIIMSMVWLAIFAILMTDVVEYFGCGIGIDSTVMGLSLGAIGTSFPNLYASILIAKQGAGDGAVCQAIAANTFNGCICLGLLWLVHTLGLGSCDYGSHVSAHHGSCNGCYAPTGLKPLCPFWEGTNNAFGRAAGSTKGAILLTFLWAVIFTLAMIFFRGRINKGMAAVFIALYLTYIGYQFVAAFAPVAICISAWNICI